MDGCPLPHFLNLIERTEISNWDKISYIPDSENLIERTEIFLPTHLSHLLKRFESHRENGNLRIFASASQMPLRESHRENGNKIGCYGIMYVPKENLIERTEIYKFHKCISP